MIYLRCLNGLLNWLNGNIEFIKAINGLSPFLCTGSSLNCIKKPCLTDLNSTNGTELNGTSLVPNEGYVIREGDMVKLGRSIYTFTMVG